MKSKKSVRIRNKSLAKVHGSPKPRRLPRQAGRAMPKAPSKPKARKSSASRMKDRRALKKVRKESKVAARSTTTDAAEKRLLLWIDELKLKNKGQKIKGCVMPLKILHAYHAPTI